MNDAQGFFKVINSPLVISFKDAPKFRPKKRHMDEELSCEISSCDESTLNQEADIPQTVSDHQVKPKPLTFTPEVRGISKQEEAVCKSVLFNERDEDCAQQNDSSRLLSMDDGSARVDILNQCRECCCNRQSKAQDAEASGGCGLSEGKLFC